MKLNSRQYLLLARRHAPNKCYMTFPLFGGRATMTLGFADNYLSGTWSYQFAYNLLKKAQAIHTMEVQRWRQE